MPDFRMLKLNLPPLDLQQPVAWGASAEGRVSAAEEYLRYYRLDLSRRLEGITQHFGALNLAGYRIACHVFLPESPQATVFITHGYFDHSGLFEHLIEYLVKQGYAVVAWDLPGHGLSSGEQAAIGSFDEYTDCLQGLLQSLAGQLPMPWHAVGQSTGGAILMRYLFRCRERHDSTAFARIVLLAPLLRITQWAWVRLQYALGRRFLTEVKRVFVPNSHNRAFVDFVQRLDPLQSRVVTVRWIGAMLDAEAAFAGAPVCKQRVLLVQGEADTTVAWKYNLPHIATKFPALHIQRIPGASHHLANEAEPMRSQVFAAVIGELQGQETAA